MGTIKNKVYFVSSFAMLVYAMPKLQVGHGWSPPTIFAIVWLFFALVIVAAQLYSILGADKESEQTYHELKQMRKWQREQWSNKRSKPLH